MSLPQTTGSLVCRIELNKTTGITLTVENSEGNITQTAVMDGVSMVFTCKGESEESTITQKVDSVAIKCKDFLIEAETVTVKSSEDMLHESQKKLDIKSSENMTLDSGAQFQASASSDVKVSGSKVSVKADGDAELSGGKTLVKAMQKATVQGGDLELSGSLKADMKGTMVTISSDGTLSVKGQLTTLEGQITNVKGTLVKLG